MLHHQWVGANVAWMKSKVLQYMGLQTNIWLSSFEKDWQRCKEVFGGTDSIYWLDQRKATWEKKGEGKKQGCTKPKRPTSFLAHAAECARAQPSQVKCALVPLPSSHSHNTQMSPSLACKKDVTSTYKKLPIFVCHWHFSKCPTNLIFNHQHASLSTWLSPLECQLFPTKNACCIFPNFGENLNHSVARGVGPNLMPTLPSLLVCIITDNCSNNSSSTTIVLLVITTKYHFELHWLVPNPLSWVTYKSIYYVWLLHKNQPNDPVGKRCKLQVKNC